MFKIVCKACTLILIASLVWTNGDVARNFVTDVQQTTEVRTR